MKLPYGGFDAEKWDIDHAAAPWLHLHEIQRQLEAGQALRPDLAQWIGEAIKRSGNDPAQFMRLLGLVAPRGRPATYARHAWLQWGYRICELESDGMAPERALERVASEIAAAGGTVPDRRQLARWRDKYRTASEEHEE